MSTAADFETWHDKRKKTVFLKIDGEDQAAFVQYEKEGKTLDLYHSFVPEHLRGRGHGRVLAREAVRLLIKDGNSLKLSCSYLQLYFNRHAEQDLTEEQREKCSLH